MNDSAAMSSTAMSSTTPPSTNCGSFSSGLRDRLRLTGWSVVHVLLAVPVLVLFIVLATGISISVIGVGLLLVLVAVPATEQMAALHRRMAARILGKPIASPYARRSGGSVWEIMKGWAVDPARWRDFAWTFAACTVGWTLSWVPLAAVLGAIWYLVYPFVWSVTPDGILDAHYGVYTIDSQGETFVEWIWLIIVIPLWWWLTPLVVRARTGLDRALLAPSRDLLERRVDRVAQTRDESLDHSAAELRRIERDLHDGAQARLVALGMNLGLAEELLTSDPEAAARLLSEARETSTSALGDLRSVVRGIHPPVLADRGLVGAVQALALDLSVPVVVEAAVAGSPPDPVESAAYFATVELLANIGKHAHAARGGAALIEGGGLAGVARRLAALDGTMDLESPAGGPTTITLEIPCALSSPRTTSSSATD